MRLIDAEHFHDKIDWEDEGEVYFLEQYLFVEPTVDAVPVVRCNSCKHWFCEKDDGYCHSCDIDALLRPGNHFCSYGVRKEDSNDKK